MTARQFAAHIRKTAFVPVKVKIGQTNGQDVFHVIETDRPQRSMTIKGEGEWALHPANDANRPSKAEREAAQAA